MKTILKEIAKPVFALFFLANYANCVFAQNETFGPYITTQWSQYSPFNNEFPTINGTKVPAGCTTISTAQILNFYKHCNKLDLKGSHEIYAAVESPYFSNTKMEGNNFKFDYEYSYTPDFDNIDYDKNVEELSKFLFAISLAQSCYYDVDGSMTSYYVQFGCFQNIFGYDGEIHFREKDVLDVSGFSLDGGCCGVCKIRAATSVWRAMGTGCAVYDARVFHLCALAVSYD